MMVCTCQAVAAISTLCYYAASTFAHKCTALYWYCCRLPNIPPHLNCVATLPCEI